VCTSNEVTHGYFYAIICKWTVCYHRFVCNHVHNGTRSQRRLQIMRSVFRCSTGTTTSSSWHYPGIARVSSVKILGVTMSSSQSVSQHVTNLCAQTIYMHYALCERTAWMSAPFAHGISVYGMLSASGRSAIYPVSVGKLLEVDRRSMRRKRSPKLLAVDRRFTSKVFGNY